VWLLCLDSVPERIDRSLTLRCRLVKRELLETLRFAKIDSFDMGECRFKSAEFIE
jgi:hypothetical protein